MEFGPYIFFSSYTNGSKSDKVFHRFWRNIAEQANNNPANWMIINHDIEVYLISDSECFRLKEKFFKIIYLFSMQLQLFVTNKNKIKFNVLEF